MKNFLGLKVRIISGSLKLFSLKNSLNTLRAGYLRVTHMSKGGPYNQSKSKDILFSAVLNEAGKMWRKRNLEGLDKIEKLSVILIWMLTT